MKPNPDPNETYNITMIEHHINYNHTNDEYFIIFYEIHLQTHVSKIHKLTVTKNPMHIRTMVYDISKEELIELSVVYYILKEYIRKEPLKTALLNIKSNSKHNRLFIETIAKLTIQDQLKELLVYC